MSNLITPYGGSLVDLLVKGKEREDLLQKAVDLPSFQISERAICDLELLATGAFSPLDRFMNESDYLGVLNDMKLSDGTMFPMPVTLSLDEEELKKEKVQIGSSIV
jgi:ATP sulfurylase (sulfate adenylyltransferase)